MSRRGPIALRRLVGASRQVARAELFEVLDGPGRGSRVARLTTASGLDIEVLPDRGMDLGMVSWRGVPVAWSSPVGVVAPERTGDSAEAWERGFGGGLVTTCGWDQFGRASVSESGEALPMHGRAHTLVASDVRTWASPFDDPGTVGFAGTTRQVTALGECLRVDREVIASTTDATLTIRDRVTNEAPVAWPQLVLYHVNLGWPLVDADAVLEIGGSPADHVPVPRDAAAAAGQGSWDRMPEPQDHYAEQVFRHPLDGLEQGIVRLTSPNSRTALTLRFDTAALPVLYQWKQASAGRYALGIEPANAIAIDGQAEARANGTLPILEPGGSQEYALTFEFEALGADDDRLPTG